MVKVSFDQAHNTVVIIMGENFVAAGAEELYSAVKQIAPKLKKGFSVITDLSSLEAMDINTQHFIEKTMDLLNQRGVSKVVRIIPDHTKDIGLNIMSLFHYSGDVAIHSCKTLKEAEELLTKKEHK